MCDSGLAVDGNMALAAYPGSYGRLTLDGAGADVQRSLLVGGMEDAEGGTALVKLINHGLLMVGREPNDKIIIRLYGKVTLDESDVDIFYEVGDRGDIIVEGTLEGAGMVWGHVTNPDGSVRPGQNSAGKVLEIGGNYTQGNEGMLDIQIGGSQEDADFGKLYVSNGGIATLAGKLHVALVNGFIPNNWDYFRIVDAPDGLTGVFDNAVMTYTLEDGSMFDVLYTATEVYLMNFRAVPGCVSRPRSDLNGDCKVNFFDFAIMAGEWLQCGLYPFESCQE